MLPNKEIIHIATVTHHMIADYISTEKTSLDFIMHNK